MITANCQRHGASLHDLSEECFDAFEGPFKINWVYGGITTIRHTT